VTVATTAPAPDEAPSGLEGVVAFRTEIAEPDRDGGALRYRGVDLEELAGRVPFERVWGLLVDGAPAPGLPPAGDALEAAPPATPPRRRSPRPGSPKAPPPPSASSWPGAASPTAPRRARSTPTG